MQGLSFKRHRFPPEVIRYTVWLYFRFTLSLRDIEELLAQRGIEVSYETIRMWTIKFGPLIASNLRSRKGQSSGRWHLDEMMIKISAGGCICGGPLMMKVRFWMSWFRSAATPTQPISYCGDCQKIKASSPNP